MEDVIGTVATLCLPFLVGFWLGRESKTEIRLMGDLHIKNQHGPINLSNPTLKLPTESSPCES